MNREELAESSVSPAPANCWSPRSSPGSPITDRTASRA